MTGLCMLLSHHVFQCHFSNFSIGLMHHHVLPAGNQHKTSVQEFVSSMKIVNEEYALFSLVLPTAASCLSQGSFLSFPPKGSFFDLPKDVVLI